MKSFSLISLLIVVFALAGISFVQACETSTDCPAYPAEVCRGGSCTGTSCGGGGEECSGEGAGEVDGSCEDGGRWVRTCDDDCRWRGWTCEGGGGGGGGGGGDGDGGGGGGDGGGSCAITVCGSVDPACRTGGNRFRYSAPGGGCGGGTGCDSSGRIFGSCTNCPCGCIVEGGECSLGQTQCSGNTYQTCSSSCSWQNGGTDADGDGVDSQCGDSLCDNAYAVRDSTRTSTETNCADSLDNDCDGARDCQDTDCAGQTGPGGVICCQSASNCPQDDCVVESCVSNQCQFVNRATCDSSECGSGQYCYSGDCTDPDVNEYVCLNCAPDTTSGRWDWEGEIFEDAGIGYSTNDGISTRLFDSVESTCGGTTCTRRESGCGCYDSSSTALPIRRKRALTTGNCCGNDPNEWYKRDYYGGECTSSISDCVWSDGNAQQGNSGNKEWWCNPGNWYECNDNTIGQGSPNNEPPSGVCCAGVAGDNGWTPVPEVLPENLYSCTDGKDNDCDGLIDCQDDDCDGYIAGAIKDTDSQPIAQADITAKKVLANFKSVISEEDGTYNMRINCGTYNVVASHPDYGPGTRENVVVQPNQMVIEDFTLTLGSSCEDDCTFVSDDIVHASCDGRNGCSFFDYKAKAACDLSQPGWIRDYDENNFIVCPEGAPNPKVEAEASISCSSGTLVKVTRIVYYNGKPVKLVVAACG